MPGKATDVFFSDLRKCDFYMIIMLQSTSNTTAFLKQPTLAKLALDRINAYNFIANCTWKLSFFLNQLQLYHN